MENKRIYGYCRVSTEKQDIARQVRNIKKEYPTAIIYQDTYTGTKLDRPNWTKLKQLIYKKKVDVIVFDSISRMSRNAEQGFEEYCELYNAGVELIFLKEPFCNTATYKESASMMINIDNSENDEVIAETLRYINKLIMILARKQIQQAFAQAEKEVVDLQQRTKEGIETARQRGKQIGRKEGQQVVTKKAVIAYEIIKKYSKVFNGNLSDVDVMNRINLKYREQGLLKPNQKGISIDTYYRYKKQLLQELK